MEEDYCLTHSYIAQYTKTELYCECAPSRNRCESTIVIDRTFYLALSMLLSIGYSRVRSHQVSFYVNALLYVNASPLSKVKEYQYEPT